MVAKGLNFRGVNLVGIILADTGLHLPDFRSLERTFSLIVQVAGRAGRFAEGGRVIVQTYSPGNNAIRSAAAAAGDAEGASPLEDFYNSELEIRKQLMFPPFSRLFRLVFRGKALGDVTSAAAACTGALQENLKGFSGPGTTDLLGPSECPLSVIAGNHRYQLLVRTTAFGKVHSLLEQVLRGLKIPRGLYLEIDVDPVSLL
jgi:primosomal protein N' (replication factor Y)